MESCQKMYVFAVTTTIFLFFLSATYSKYFGSPDVKRVPTVDVFPYRTSCNRQNIKY